MGNIKSQGESKGRWYSGNPPDPKAKTVFIVETVVYKGRFYYLGRVTVTDLEVHDGMERHRSIKGYMPSDVAKRKARRKFPKAKTILVTPKIYWEDKYGKEPFRKCVRCGCRLKQTESPRLDLCSSCYKDWRGD